MPSAEDERLSTNRIAPQCRVATLRKPFLCCA